MLANCVVVSSEKFIPHTYESLADSDKQHITLERYAQFVDWYNHVTDAQTSKIVYMSDGLKIVGFIMQPAKSESKKLPVIIYNRGGSNDDGKINVATLKNRIYPLVQAGYIVIASQYRGNDSSQGKDELAGADVNDVLALFDVIQTLPNADLNNIFMVGYSRGAMNSCVALKKGAQVNALALAAGVLDLLQFEQERPDTKPIMDTMIPNLPEQREIEYKKRSVMFWPEAMNVPILLLHGKADEIVRVNQAQKFSKKLNDLGKVHTLVLYEGCDHFFTGFKKDCAQEILEWFEQYRTSAI